MKQGIHRATIEPPTADLAGICERIRAALEPVRAQALSLHSGDGELLWLTESSMGPDEHNAVREAFDAFANASGPTVLAYELGNCRSAVLFRVIDGHRAMVGAAMAIVDSRAIKQEGLQQLMTQRLRRALGEFAALRCQTDAAPPSPAKPPAARAPGAPRAPAGDAAGPPERRAPDRPMTGAPNAGAPQGICPDIDKLRAAMRRTPIALSVQQLIPLAKGSRLQRYEVLLRSGAESAPNSAPQAMLKAAVENGLGSLIDRRVLKALVAWLVRHPAIWHDEAIMFSVNLTKTALHDEHFMKFIDQCIGKAAIPGSMIGFEVDVPSAIAHSGRIAELALDLQWLGCPLILDNFSMRTECFDLLRLPGLRYIKMAPAMTATMRTDKVSQAAITALVQMAHVLGLHVVAKRMESPIEQEWLTALGVDFVQSNALSPPVTIDSLRSARSPAA
jgi:EAL domain-containing protein (putative c-di-GMP-specific phosphodiesterase class I)